MHSVEFVTCFPAVPNFLLDDWMTLYVARTRSKLSRRIQATFFSVNSTLELETFRFILNKWQRRKQSLEKMGQKCKSKQYFFCGRSLERESLKAGLILWEKTLQTNSLRIKMFGESVYKKYNWPNTYTANCKDQQKKISCQVNLRRPDISQLIKTLISVNRFPKEATPSLFWKLVIFFKSCFRCDISVASSCFQCYRLNRFMFINAIEWNWMVGLLDSLTA